MLLNATIDTGAGASIIDCRLYQQFPHAKNSSLSLKDIGNKHIFDFGFALVPLTIRGITVNYPMVMMNSSICFF